VPLGPLTLPALHCLLDLPSGPGLATSKALWPFPSARLAELAQQVRGMLVVEMNAGQMLEDVRLAVEGTCPVRFYGRLGGIIPLPDEILLELDKLDTELRTEEEA